MTYQALKSKLTRAERMLDKDPDRALAIAAEVRAAFDVHGWPDWWSRVDRLEHDARFAQARKGW